MKTQALIVLLFIASSSSAQSNGQVSADLKRTVKDGRGDWNSLTSVTVTSRKNPELRHSGSGWRKETDIHCDFVGTTKLKTGAIVKCKGDGGATYVSGNFDHPLFYNLKLTDPIPAPDMIPFYKEYRASILGRRYPMKNLTVTESKTRQAPNDPYKGKSYAFGNIDENISLFVDIEFKRAFKEELPRNLWLDSRTPEYTYYEAHYILSRKISADWNKHEKTYELDKYPRDIDVMPKESSKYDKVVFFKKVNESVYKDYLKNSDFKKENASAFNTSFKSEKEAAVGFVNNLRKLKEADIEAYLIGSLAGSCLDANKSNLGYTGKRFHLSIQKGAMRDIISKQYCENSTPFISKNKFYFYNKYSQEDASNLYIEVVEEDGEYKIKDFIIQYQYSTDSEEVRDCAGNLISKYDFGIGDKVSFKKGSERNGYIHSMDADKGFYYIKSGTNFDYGMIEGFRLTLLEKGAKQNQDTQNELAKKEKEANKVKDDYAVGDKIWMETGDKKKHEGTVTKKYDGRKIGVEVYGKAYMAYPEHLSSRTAADSKSSTDKTESKSNNTKAKKESKLGKGLKGLKGKIGG